MYNKKIFERCFCYKGRYWYKNIKYIPLYFRLMHHLIKYGYDEYATWETFDWFTDTMRSVLIDYRKHHYGTPILCDNFPWKFETEEEKAIDKENSDKWNGIIDRMIELLNDMDEGNPKYESMDLFEVDKVMNQAKEEFFKLFSEHFYRLWD